MMRAPIGDPADTIHIGPAKRQHFCSLRNVELASFETLRAAGAVTGDPAASSDEELLVYLDAGLLLAAFDGAESPVGYAGGYVREGWLHIGEVDVHPQWQRRGIGRRLINALLNEGRSRHLVGSTLTTDRFAPFNAPFYASLGFHAVEGDACPARLKGILTAEVSKGLNPLRRVAMMLVF
ncbi:GNAT family N-acetyltransferase [Agrobacterium vitis]|uniref:GNAT family N-acetyltransferase n=1 Tax=Agrobacterium vitis TaxID=373 RepID=A0ABD6G7R4_AGRVI|nr:GNAT family N-acetyltransferase [Agrobacterium vitis]MUO77591.1 GNAT family N-acetyltransferase [Agrobacterium vitis]MUO93108.1 GNAT family N-acetyltransferase [Agrobacterium vitis]MUP04459.1 GNAT family N-acetyltransferase [Agrobacterium vitis]MUZ81101.1 GNAT family N-acetyltransferase [Agrobacterium vitis]MVA08713.1 GNAT family N-acetyltransferase [Agrobacterium vitis]